MCLLGIHIFAMTQFAGRSEMVFVFTQCVCVCVCVCVCAQVMCCTNLGSSVVLYRECLKPLLSCRVPGALASRKHTIDSQCTKTEMC